MSKIPTFQILARKLNEEGIKWGVGGSFLLHIHGLTNKYNDFDILVKEDDAFKIDRILSKVLTKVVCKPTEPFCTKYFYTYTSPEISVDVMGGLGIKHSSGTYFLNFTERNIVGKTMGDIFLSSLEDWYILYSLMPGKTEKVRIIEAYWGNHPIKHKTILSYAISSNLPEHIIFNINKLLDSK